MNLKMGKESYILLFYFPVMISLLMLLGRKETLKHLIILSGVCLLSIITITVCYRNNYYTTRNSVETTENLYVFNIILSFVTTIGFSLVIIFESIAQENLIKKILHEKEILLAEVFHRVKNNMNIITSLLNLKKNMSDSIDVKNALEDCRNRVFSMALVHENIFKSDNIVGLNFKEYIKNLVAEIANSLGHEKNVEIILDTDEVYLDLSSAIPCGLILNELITNSYKYALTKDKKLQIQVKLKSNSGKIELEVKDNGPGIPEDTFKNKKTLGLEIIQSLSDQIDGLHTFTNSNGLIFNLKFSSK